MKKMILAAVLATLAGSSAFAQSYSGSTGTGNIAPNVTAANPDGVFRYQPTDHAGRVAYVRRGHEAYAQAPARAFAQDVTGSVNSRTNTEFYKGTDPDPNIQFQLHREEQEGW